MDLFTAGVSETHVPSGKVGPTFACMLGEQFRSLKNGDRFYYENVGPGAFTQGSVISFILPFIVFIYLCRETLEVGEEIRKCL